MLTTVYMGRVDPHLISGADVCPDAVSSHVQMLEDAQHAFLRRALGLGPRSCIVPLFSETGLWPIRVRRAVLCLDYLKYCLARPQTELVSYALQDSFALARLGCLSWYGDLQAAAEHLGGHLSHGVSVSEEQIASTQDRLRRAMLARINAEFESASRLSLLRGQTSSGRVGREGVTLSRREYLRIDKKGLRRALTRLLVSDHTLAVETLRYASRSHQSVPREERLCRFGCAAVEDEIHALFACKGDPALLLARERFARDIAGHGWLELLMRTVDEDGYGGLIQLMLKDKHQAACLARLARDCCRTFDTVPVRRV